MSAGGAASSNVLGWARDVKVQFVNFVCARLLLLCCVVCPRVCSFSGIPGGVSFRKKRHNFLEFLSGEVLRASEAVRVRLGLE